MESSVAQKNLLLLKTNNFVTHLQQYALFAEQKLKEITLKRDWRHQTEGR
jgi:hypothetical protein